MNLQKKIKILAGILTKRALTGPAEVSIDITRQCSTGCVMCWYWSPLLKERPSSEWVGESIDLETFLTLIKDLKKMDVKRIIMGGQGDPFMHPRFMEMITAVKAHGLELAIITSGYYFNEAKIRALFELGVDHLDVSLQAATSESYCRIHPELPPDTFERIKKSLLLLSDLKRRAGVKNPAVALIDAICAPNYRDTVKIVELAKEVGAGRVGFKRLDIIAETSSLLLKEDELKELETLITQAERRASELGIETGLDFYRKYIMSGLLNGNYTSDYYSWLPCYVGWLSARILSDGSVIPCCGCWEKPLGNIRRNSFPEIWRSEEYQTFRNKSIEIFKHPEMVSGCKCSSCNDFAFNLNIYKKIHPFKQNG